jgi:hypothetical protein
MTKPNYAHIHVLFDRSGSMAGRESDVQNWYRVFIEEQKKVVGDCTISLATFDSQSYDTVIEWADIKNVSRTFKLDPRGGTPLLDSTAKSINDLGARLAKMPEAARPSKVIVVIQTDGEENSSHEYKLETLKALITKQQDVYNWNFMFLGADINAYDDAQLLGIRTYATASYGSNARGYASMAFNSSAAIGRYRDGTSQNISYTVSEQKEMEATKDVPVTTTNATVAVTP